MVELTTAGLRFESPGDRQIREQDTSPRTVGETVGTVWGEEDG
ncbi:hypothetical protein ACFQHN_19580 [Natrialbaceae archaeon GCM10025896]